jgi:hypothetical protein
MTDLPFVDRFAALSRLSNQRSTGSELDDSIEEFCQERQRVRARRELRLLAIWGKEGEEEFGGPVG